MSDAEKLVEAMARGIYAENGWLRVVLDDDGKGRYRDTPGSHRMRYVEWEQLDTDERDSRLREARAALTALHTAGYRVVPVEMTEEQYEALSATGKMWRETNSRDVYRVLVAAAPKVTP